MKKIIALLVLIPLTCQAMPSIGQIDNDVFARYKENSYFFDIMLYKKEKNIKTNYEIGSARISYKGYNTFYLDHIRLDKNFQNKGYGSVLLALALKECLKQNPQKIRWEANPDTPELLPNLLKFYAQFGAKATYINQINPRKEWRAH